MDAATMLRKFRSFLPMAMYYIETMLRAPELTIPVPRKLSTFEHHDEYKEWLISRTSQESFNSLYQLCHNMASRLHNHYRRQRLILQQVPVTIANTKLLLNLSGVFAPPPQPRPFTVYLLFHNVTVFLNFPWTCVAMFHVQVLFLFPFQYETIQNLLHNNEHVICFLNASENKLDVARLFVSDSDVDKVYFVDTTQILRVVIDTIIQRAQQQQEDLSVVQLRMLPLYLSVGNEDEQRYERVLNNIAKTFFSFHLPVNLGFVCSPYEKWETALVLIHKHSTISNHARTTAKSTILMVDDESSDFMDHVNTVARNILSHHSHFSQFLPPASLKRSQSTGDLRNTGRSKPRSRRPSFAFSAVDLITKSFS